MSVCRLCNSTFFKTWTVKDAKSNETLEMAMCGHCALVQQMNLPSDEALRIYYSHNYREDYKSTHRPKPKYVYRAGMAAKDRLAFIARAGIAADGRTLIDIGAGGGEFCYLAKRAGFAVEGVEPHVGYSEYARDHYDVSIQTNDIHGLAERKADVVTMFHVFEHLAHPLLAIRKIWEVLRDNGHLVIEVPNIHQSDASPHNIYFKAHLFYYSRYSLMAAVSQYFELVSVEDKGNLFMALRRRAQPLGAPVWPTAFQLQHTEDRLQAKGWREYLIEGQGWRKIFRRIGNTLPERRAAAMSAREVLDHVWQKAGYGSSAVWPGVSVLVAMALLLEACY